MVEYEALVKLANEVYAKTLSQDHYIFVNVSDVCPNCHKPLLSVIEETVDLLTEEWEYVCKGCGAEGTLEEIRKG